MHDASSMNTTRIRIWPREVVRRPGLTVQQGLNQDVIPKVKVVLIVTAAETRHRARARRKVQATMGEAGASGASDGAWKVRCTCLVWLAPICHVSSDLFGRHQHC